MSYFKASWWRPATLTLAMVAIAALWLMGSGASLAGSEPATIAVDPTDAEVGLSGTVAVDINVTAPAAGVSIWIVQVQYDPTKVEVNTVGGNPDCDALAIDAGVSGASGCDTKDTNSDSVKDTAVALGGWVKNNNGTAEGFSGTKTVATFRFKAAAGAQVDDVSPLTFKVAAADLSILDPNGNDIAPGAGTDGTITIIEQQGTQVVWGNADCGAAFDIGDSINIQRAIAGLNVNYGAGCPTLGGNATVDGVASTWGNFDCGAAFDIGDAINVERAISGLSINYTGDCHVIGTDTVNVVAG